MDVKAEDIEAVVVTGYTLWKWYHEAKKAKAKEKPQGGRGKRKPRGKKKN